MDAIHEIMGLMIRDIEVITRDVQKCGGFDEAIKMRLIIEDTRRKMNRLVYSGEVNSKSKRMR